AVSPVWRRGKMCHASAQGRRRLECTRPAPDTSRSRNMAPRVVTVTGPVPPERIGFTLPHEHTSCRPELVRTRQELIDFTSDVEVVAADTGEFRPHVRG